MVSPSVAPNQLCSYLTSYPPLTTCTMGKLIYTQNDPLSGTAVQPVFNPFSQLVPQLELYSQLQLSLWSDPITFSVPKSTW